MTAAPTVNVAGTCPETEIAVSPAVLSWIARGSRQRPRYSFTVITTPRFADARDRQRTGRVRQLAERQPLAPLVFVALKLPTVFAPWSRSCRWRKRSSTTPSYSTYPPVDVTLPVSGDVDRVLRRSRIAALTARCCSTRHRRQVDRIR